MHLPRPTWVSASLQSLPVSPSPLSPLFPFLPPPLRVSVASFFLWSLPPPFFGLFPPLSSVWILLLFFLPFWLFPPYPCLRIHRHTHPVCRFSPRPRAVTCCWEMSVGCLASLQGFVSSPFPSLRLLVQPSSVWLTVVVPDGRGLMVGWWWLSARKRAVCEGVGLPPQPGLPEPCCLGSRAGAVGRRWAPSAHSWG